MNTMGATLGSCQNTVIVMAGAEAANANAAATPAVLCRHEAVNADCVVLACGVAPTHKPIVDIGRSDRCRFDEASFSPEGYFLSE
jgi:hypothetical protein